MAIAFVNVATAQANSSTTSLAVNVPSGVVNGNLMITILELNAAVTVTQPGGWTSVGNGAPAQSGTNTLDAWWRIASSEPASYTWTFGSAKCNICALAYSGTTATPIETGAFGSNTSPTATTGSITVSNNDWNIAIYSDRDASAGSTWTTPTGTTSRAGLLNTGTSEGSLAVFDTNAAVTAGSYTYTSTSSTTQSTTVTGAIGILAAATGVAPPPFLVRQAVNRAGTY